MFIGAPILAPLGSGVRQTLKLDHADTARWYVLHTRSRQEKVVAEHLAARKTRCFLPMLELTRQYGKRKIRAELPMFPGYVFLHGTVDEVYEADRTRRLAQIIHVTDQGQLDRELENIRLALQRQAVLDPYPYLKQGVWVRVRSGPLEGLEGVVEERSRPDRLLLGVQMLNRAMSVEIDAALLEAI